MLNRVENWIVVGIMGTAVFLVEWLLMPQQVLAGILLYSILLICLLLYGTYRWPHPQRQLLALAIPVVIRLMAYTLPLAELSPLFAQLVVSVPIALTAAVLVWLLEQTWPDWRFKWQRIPYYLLLITLGSAAGLLLYQVQQPTSISSHDPLFLIFQVFVLIVAMAFLEEWLFRGIMQTALHQLWGNGLLAGLTVAFFYTILNFGQGPWLYLLLIFVFALVLSWLRHTSDSLLEVCLVHSAANLTFFLILPEVGTVDVLADMVAWGLLS